MGEASAAVREPACGSAFVLGARISRLAASSGHANLLAEALIATAGVTVGARRAYALVLTAHESIADAVAAEDRFRLAAATGRDITALGAAVVASAGVLLATANEVLVVGAADASFGAAPALDGAFTAVWQGAAFDRNPEGSEISHHLLTGPGRALGLFRIVATAVAVPAEVPRRAVGGLAATKETVWNGKVAATEGEESEYQSTADPHQKVPFTKIPVGPMLTSGMASS